MKLRPWIGVLLVVLSVAAMYIWETRLRSKVELRTVLVYSRDVEAGEEMAPDHFKLISTTPESVVPGGLSEHSCGTALNVQSSITVYAVTRRRVCYCRPSKCSGLICGAVYINGQISAVDIHVVST